MMGPPSDVDFYKSTLADRCRRGGGGNIINAMRRLRLPMRLTSRICIPAVLSFAVN